MSKARWLLQYSADFLFVFFLNLVMYVFWWCLQFGVVLKQIHNWVQFFFSIMFFSEIVYSLVTDSNHSVMALILEDNGSTNECRFWRTSKNTSGLLLLLETKRHLNACSEPRYNSDVFHSWIIKQVHASLTRLFPCQIWLYWSLEPSFFSQELQKTAYDTINTIPVKNVVVKRTWFWPFGWWTPFAFSLCPSTKKNNK